VRVLPQLRAIVSGVLLFASASASGQTHAPPLALGWSAPGACPGAHFVEQEVSRVVGRPWSELASDWREARASVQPEGGGYRLRVNVVTRAGVAHERSVMAASCTEATEAAVAILSASMAPAESAAEGTSAVDTAGTRDGNAEGHGHAEGQGNAEGQEPADGSGPALVDTGMGARTAAVDGEGLRIRPALGARLGLDFGTLARVAPFVQLSGGAEIGRFVASALVGATGSVTGEIDSGLAGAQMFLAMAGLEVCGFITRGNPALSGCGGVELGSLQASGFGTADRRSGRTFWSASLARAALDWHITDTSVASFGATLVVPFRELVVVAPPEVVHRTPDIAVRPALGLGVQFP
jgi:hypothetical protein